MESKRCGFKPRTGYGFVKVIKLGSTPSFGWEIMPEAPCCKILWHVKEPCICLRTSSGKVVSKVYSFTDPFLKKSEHMYPTFHLSENYFFHGPFSSLRHQLDSPSTGLMSLFDSLCQHFK
jgi:hypothetical protein